MKILYLDSIAGIAGDMFTASFIDAGLVTLHELNQLAQQLKIANIRITQSQALRAHMRGTYIDVNYDQSAWLHNFSNADTHPHVHIPYGALVQLIEVSDLSTPVKSLSQKILSVLAGAEAHCHGVDQKQVIFHEIGMADSITDIVMAAYCITKCNPDQIVAAPLKLGRGMINITHGTQPVPPPVSAALIVNMIIADLPFAIKNSDIELSTPTGLAIVKALNPAFSAEWPAGKILQQGYGAGKMDLENYPNLFRMVLLETDNESDLLPYTQDKIIEMSVNYDDATPEHLAWACEKLFDYGAMDVWQTSSIGKKGRVLIVLSALIPTPSWPQCINFILKHTSSFGLRYKQLDRLILDRYIEKRDHPQGSYRVKIGCDRQGEKIKEKTEFDDVSRQLDQALSKE